jgi:hypothetical protein
MTVADLAGVLKRLPQHLPVEVMVADSHIATITDARVVNPRPRYKRFVVLEHVPASTISLSSGCQPTIVDLGKGQSGQ